MAADTGLWDGDVMIDEVTDKIIRLDDGSLLGCAGVCAVIDSYVAWAKAGFPHDEKPEPAETSDEFGGILAVSPDEVWLIDHRFRRERLQAPYMVEGVGVEFGYGCLLTGASASETVALAIKHVAHCAGRVVTHRLIAEDEAQPPEPTIDDVLDDEPIEPPAEGTKEYYGL